LDFHGDGYVELALELGVAPGRIDTTADYAAAARYGVKTVGGAEAGPGAPILAELADLICEGQLELPIARIYPLENVREAYADLARRHTHGKIVLTPGEVSSPWLEDHLELDPDVRTGRRPPPSTEPA